MEWRNNLSNKVIVYASIVASGHFNPSMDN